MILGAPRVSDSLEPYGLRFQSTVTQECHNLSPFGTRNRSARSNAAWTASASRAAGIAPFEEDHRAVVTTEAGEDRLAEAAAADQRAPIVAVPTLITAAVLIPARIEREDVGPIMNGPRNGSSCTWSAWMTGSSGSAGKPSHSGTAG